MAAEKDSQALSLALTLGVVQEAQRLRHRRVGTEHALLASFADPVVRRVLHGAGCDLREVQKLVTEESAERNTDRPDEVELTASAVELLTHVAGQLPGVPPAEALDPMTRSLAMCSIMIAVMEGERDTAASRVLDAFDLRQQAPGLIAAIREQAGPPMPGTSADDTSGLAARW